MRLRVLASAPKRAPNLQEAGGRNFGQTAGSHVTALAEAHKAIVLCGLCKNRFNERPYGYFREKNIAVGGRCDGCGEVGVQQTLFIHQSLLGQSWTPRRGR